MSRTTEGAPARAGHGSARRGRGPARRALSTLILVSRFPVPLKGEPDFSGVPLWLPMVGFAAALVAAGGYALSSLAFATGGARAFCALLFLYLAFDLFHLDGLLDSADAFMGGGSRERRLEILKDPRVGSFGLFAGVAYLGALWYCAARASALPLFLAPAVLAAPVAGRAASALVPVFLAPARPGGLGAMLQPYSKRAAWTGLALSAAICLAIAWLSALFLGEARAAAGAAPAVSAEATGIIARFPAVGRSLTATGVGFVCGVAAGLLPMLASYGRKLGGYTGDALGAAVCLGSLGHLACALAILGVL